MPRQTDSQQQSGFSLVELLISLTIMLIVTGAAFSLMRGAIQISTTNYDMTDTQQSLRTAQEFITRDLTVVGDGMRGINNTQVPINFVTSYLSSRSAAVLDPTNTGFVNLQIASSDDSVASGTVVTGASPAANVRAGTDRLVILTRDWTFTPITLGTSPAAITNNGGNTRISVSTSDIGRFNVGEIYYLTNGSDAAFFTITAKNTGANHITAASGDTYNLNAAWATSRINTVSTGGTVATSLLRMRIIEYYVNDSDQMVRRVYGVSGAGFTDSVIAEHITGLQLRYFLDLTDTNGNLVQPLTQLTTSAQQTAVREVEVTVTAATAHKVVTGANNTPVAQSISSTTRTTVRNLQFRQADQPTTGG